MGVNLNPDKVCNFDCIYCQVDRRSESETRFVELGQVLEELAVVLKLITSGEIYADNKFANTPETFRRLNDIAFSGDGEPTTYRNFDEIIDQVATVKRELADDARMVLITNASMLHRPHVQRGLEIMDHNNGQVWAKLEAGTDEYYQLIERTQIPFRQILDNITSAAKIRPLVVQSLFMNVNGEPPSQYELVAFCDRLSEIAAAGGQLQLIQLYTVARQPAESFVSALTEKQLQQISELVISRTGLQTAVFP